MTKSRKAPGLFSSDTFYLLLKRGCPELGKEVTRLATEKAINWFKVGKKDIKLTTLHTAK